MIALLAAAHAGTLTVGGTGPYTTIGAAVAAARDGDTIEVAPGAWAEALDLGGKDLTVRSTGGAAVTFLAPPAGEDAVTVTRGETARLEGFTLTPAGARAIVVTASTFTGVGLVVQDAGALGLRGGGLAADRATVALASVSFSGGTATWGGQLYATNGATVDGTDLVFTGGAATYGGAVHVDGGADVTLTGVLGTSPTATRDGGFAYVDGGALTLADLALDAPLAAGGDGGGFYVTGHGALTIVGGDLAMAEADAGGAVAGTDGAVVTLEDLAIVDAFAGAGGALDLDASSATLLRVSVTDAVADEGGAVRVRGGADATCEGCTFAGCVAADDGGALLLGTGSSWEDVDGAWQDAEAGGAGGAVAIEGTARARFAGSVFEANRAGADGGALAHGGTGTLELAGASFLRNTAAGGDGGAVRSTGPFTIADAIFDGNVATLGDGGAIAAEGALALDGGRFVANQADDDGGGIVARGATLSLREATFFRNVAGRNGGAVYADAVGTITVARGYLHGNVATSGGALRLRAPTGSAALSNLRVTDNVATDGGGLHVDGALQVSVVNCTFAGNDAADAGAHVYAAAPVRLVNDLFTQAVDGGGVWATTDAGSDRHYDLVWEDAGGGWAGGWSDPTGASGNLWTDPELVAYTADGDERDDDLSLAPGSPAVDAGSPSIFDVDGTRSDIGAYGGPDADVLDFDGDGWFDNVDCDDGDASVRPGAAEVAYDAIDQDCDGADLDDVDGDGFGLVGDGDCDDADAAVYPGAPDTWYDGVDSDCGGGSDYDRDGDRHDAVLGGGDDCDDDDPLVHGTRAETWYDGVDSDCDGRSDYDRDRDGHDALAWAGDDCDDLSAARFPGNTELPYDGVDQDCSGADLVDVDGDGWVGEGAGGTDCNDGNPRVYPGAAEDPADGEDTDCDGYSEWDRDGDGWQNALGAGDDCDDDDATVNPGALETWYDGRDDDCDGRDDDQDADGWPVATDCDDTDPSVNPGAVERENGRDDDCDGWAETSDRDGDGLTDLVEAGLGTDPADPDTDDDTLSDGVEVSDRDEDGLLDALDPDDDGDGIPTRTELTTDLDGDGANDTDLDEDGAINAWDLDSDADGFDDRDEGLADTDHDGRPDYLDYQGDYTGGGCGRGWAAFGLLPLLGSWRRQRLPLDPSPRSRGEGGRRPDLQPWMPAAAGRRLLGEGRAHVLPAPLRAAPALFLALLALLPIPAQALDAHGFHLGATTGDPACFTRIGCPTVRRAGEWDAGVVFDYADDPLAEALPDGRAPVLDALATATVAGAWSFGGLQVDLAAPVHLFGVDPAGGFTALGDVRVGAQVPLLRKGAPDLALRAAVWAPTGAEAHYVGGAGPRAMVAVSVGRELGRFGGTALAGVMAGFPGEARNLREGLGPVAGVGLAYRATDALSAAVELSAASDLGQLPVEATLSTRARLPMGAWLSLGAAAGLGEGVGASRWRAFVGLGYSRRAPTPAPPPTPVDPNADRDGDGFPDATDDCPDQAETVDGFTDDDGCPELDGDGDGVPFEKDVCPREAILAAQDPRWSDGCPKVAEFAGDRISITEAIFFKEGRAELLPSSERVLAAVRDVMVAHPEVPHFLVEGHTNTTGSDTYNLRLSDARAFVVMRWLVDGGVPSERLLSKGFGEARPLQAGDSAEAMALNRRVEFRVVRIEDLPPDARRIQLPPEIAP